jgi:hypothetical protein
MNEFNGPAATTPSSCQPTLLYPPDGILLPPNTNVIEVHFLDGANGGTANNLFEISFTNSVTDVHVFTTCSNSTDPAAGMAVTNVAPATATSPGCIFQLSQAEWDYIARTNADRGPVTVSVRAVGCNGTNVYSAPTTRQISFARDDLVGALYYWSSITYSTASGNFSGGIFRYDFGVRGQSATKILTPDVQGNGNCIGCHTISRDGRKMVFDYDDNDGDDEYGDVDTGVFDIVRGSPQPSPLPSNHTGSSSTFEPGFHTWNRETTAFILSDGNNTNAGKFGLIGVNSVPLTMTQLDSARGTTPDWSPDDKTVLYAVPPANSGTYFLQSNSDLWFTQASIKEAPWNSTNNQLGTPNVLLQSTGTKNFYYPTYSPEGSIIAFDFAPSGPNFHNPLARVQLIAAGQASPTPDDLAKLNDSGFLTNSWPRFCPFVQTYQGAPLVWVTFSSTRTYGLRINNTGDANCYPDGMPSITCPGGATPTPSPCPYNRRATQSNTPACTHPQIWMAAMQLDANKVKNGIDVSYPAFWLPFQDLSHNNHLAQWAQQSFTGPCNSANDCSAGQCCESGGCTTCPSPVPSPPSCAVNANCAPGMCCPTGACVACSSTDAGTPMMSGCNTCLDCNGQACINGACGACTDSSQCCAPLICIQGMCVNGVS